MDQRDSIYNRKSVRIAASVQQTVRTGPVVDENDNDATTQAVPQEESANPDRGLANLQGPTVRSTPSAPHAYPTPTAWPPVQQGLAQQTHPGGVVVVSKAHAGAMLAVPDAGRQRFHHSGGRFWSIFSSGQPSGVSHRDKKFLGLR
eukprot:GILJ01039971.1.p1 GENE.GILJ01039971.1~~GILJ01039971.1.p1  ORF type:complete len:146 (-),score=6.57 GILJ01039971.1:7-444(-)